MARERAARGVTIERAELPPQEGIPDPIDEQLAENARADLNGQADLEEDDLVPGPGPAVIPNPRRRVIVSKTPVTEKATVTSDEVREKTFFDEAAESEKRDEARRKRDVRIGLLIGAKNLVKLRAFGYDVIDATPSLPESAHMGQAQ